jgi:hypothetical protein
MEFLLYFRTLDIKNYIDLYMDRSYQCKIGAVFFQIIHKLVYYETNMFEVYHKHQ